MKKALEVQKIKRIVELTDENYYRPDIAKEVGVSVSTVFKYQKILELV